MLNHSAQLSTAGASAAVNTASIDSVPALTAGAEAADHSIADEPCNAEASSAAAVTLEHHHLAGGKRAAAGQLDTCISLVKAAGDSENHLTAKRQVCYCGVLLWCVILVCYCRVL